jgi:hypothetical protein
MCEGGWWADPARFLGDFEGGIGRVVSDERSVALIGGKGGSVFAAADRDAVYENFRPLDIYAGGYGMGDWTASSFGKIHNIFGDFI